MSWDPALYEKGHSFVWNLTGGLVDLLAPQSGERILDVGSGTGQLTAKIAESGAHVVGIDASPEMVSRASSNYPDLNFAVADIAAYGAEKPFDAVFSNAVLHWVLDADSAAQSISAALRPGGRFVAEFGGKGNVAALLEALHDLSGIGNPWYFPSVGEYAPILERHGLEVSQAFLFDRFTPTADAQTGLRDWIRMFGRDWPRDEAFLLNMEDRLRPTLYRDGTWHIDYRRIRVVAVKR